MQKLKGSQILAKDGMIRFTNREDCLEIGPGFGTHSYLAGMFGSEGVDPTASPCTLRTTRSLTGAFSSGMWSRVPS